MIWDVPSDAAGEQVHTMLDPTADADQPLSLSAVHALLVRYWSQVAKLIYKFDHWLEMVLLDGAELLQTRLPGVIAEYKQSCVEIVPHGVAFVTFPLQPKPHDYPSEWVRDRWV